MRSRCSQLLKQAWHSHRQSFPSACEEALNTGSQMQMPASLLPASRRFLAASSAPSRSWGAALQPQQQHPSLIDLSSIFGSGSSLRAFSVAQGKSSSEEIDSLELTEAKMNAITDKIPQKPVGVVEGTSYTLIILGAFGALAYVLYNVVTGLILEPTALKCFNHTLDRLKTDPRITVRLGASDDIRAWGSNSESRVARQQIPHQIYKDNNGVEHVRLQFHMKGPSGTGLVSADMYKDDSNQWQYTYLLVDVYSNNARTPQRVHIVVPH